MSNRRVRLFPQAERDLDEEVLHLATESNPELAMQFFEAAHETFRMLLDCPDLGKARETNNPRLSGARQWKVSRFERYLIFYRADETGIVVFRVLHGSRDVVLLLDQSGYE